MWRFETCDCCKMWWSDQFVVIIIAFIPLAPYTNELSPYLLIFETCVFLKGFVTTAVKLVRPERQHSLHTRYFVAL